LTGITEDAEMAGYIPNKSLYRFSNMADMCLLIPGAVKKAPRTVIYKGKDYLETFNVFRVMLMLTSGIR
jgi:D-aminopeptidase